MVPANLFVVGKAVQSHKAALVTGFSEIIAWRSFDLRTGYYDSESRIRKTFTIRCFLKDHPQWQKFTLPNNDDLVQVQGRLVGRIRHKDTRFQYLCCRIEDFTMFGSHLKLEKATLQGSVKNGSPLPKKEILTDSTQYLDQLRPENLIHDSLINYIIISYYYSRLFLIVNFLFLFLYIFFNILYLMFFIRYPSS